MRKRFVPVSIPEELSDEIKKLVKEGKTITRARFVKEAIIKKLEDMQVWEEINMMQ